MITPIYAALIAIVFLVLSARVVVYRRTHRISLGDNGNNSLLKRMRAQANCAEYAPLAIVLMLLVEFKGCDPITVHAIGITLLSGRLAHAYGFSASPPIMNLRVAGTVLTLTAYVIAIIALLLPPYAPY